MSVRTYIMLQGGPLDGCNLNVDPADWQIDEVVFRTTEYFPGRPRDLLYRHCPVTSLDPAQIAADFIEGIRVFVFEEAEQSSLVQRVQEQNGIIKRLEVEVSHLEASNRKVFARDTRK